MIDYEGMVREFHIKYGHTINEHPTWPDIKTCKLRDRLINEEANEFQQADNILEIADAIADLLYVTFGAAIAYGIPIENIFTEVHRSNMTKSTEKDEYGKSIKGNYKPANLGPILDNAHVDE